MTVVQSHSICAQLGPDAPVLADRIEHRWSGPARYKTARTGFFTLDGVACLIDDRSGIVEVGTEPTRAVDYAPWRRWDVAIETVGWSYDGALIATTQQGDVVAWRPGSAPHVWWALPAAGGERSVFRVTSELALVVDYGDDTTKLYPVAGGAARWSIPDATTEVLPAGDRLLIRRSDLSTACIAVESGRELWTHPCAIVAIVDDLVWLEAERRLVAVALASGQVQHDLEVGLLAPHGPVDRAGVLHLATGVSYRQLDLRAGGKQLFAQGYPADRDGPIGATGLPASDGRFVFFDQKYGLWQIHADADRTLERIWKMPAPVFRWTIAHGAVFAIDQRRTLHCVAAQSSSSTSPPSGAR